MRVIFALFIASVCYVNCLSLKKLQDKFCVLGMCVSGQKDISKSMEETQTAKDETEELAKKAAELEAWHKQEADRKQQEELEKKQKTEDEANFCTCGAWMCNLNDGSICWRKCCNNEFGGPPPTRPPPPSANSNDPLARLPGYTPADPNTGRAASWNPADWRPEGALSIPFVGDVDLGWLHDKVWPNHRR
jgi:hypothetical protein